MTAFLHPIPELGNDTPIEDSCRFILRIKDEGNCADLTVLLRNSSSPARAQLVELFLRN
jgi:hypothetical protein